jgi:hypothetical protein
VVQILVSNYGRLVTRDEISEQYERAGGTISARALRALVHRIGDRIARVGLQLDSVHRRGVLLTAPGRAALRSRSVPDERPDVVLAPGATHAP